MIQHPSKRIYNGRSGVIPADPELRARNVQANAMARLGLDPNVLPYGRSASDSKAEKEAYSNQVANSLGLGKGGQKRR